MIIKELNYLDEKLMKEIKDLVEVCRKFDALKEEIYLSNELNFNKEIKYVFVLYEDNKLVSVLSVFIPTELEGEFSAYTLPEYRNRGYFKELFNRAKMELQKYKVSDILLVCEASSKSGKAVVQRLGAKYDFAEYSMKYVGKDKIDLNNFKSQLYIADMKDIDDLTNISMNGFKSNSYEDSKQFVKSILESEDRIQLLTKVNDKCIGMVSVGIHEDKCGIFGVAIMPDHRGNGFGKELVKLALNYLIKRNYDNIWLDVDSKNDIAFNLYKSIGFNVENAVEYYRI